MKVYVVEVGEHELRCIAGVYSTRELARQTHPHAYESNITEWEVDHIPSFPTSEQ